MRRAYLVSAITLLLVAPVFGATKANRPASADVVVYLFDTKTYQARVLPAYAAYLKTNDPKPVIVLIQECIRLLNANRTQARQLHWDEETLKEDIGIINGTVYYSPDEGKTNNQGRGRIARGVRQEYARQQLSGKIVEILCVPYDKGVGPEQDMTNSGLVTYLYKSSRWIEEVFTFLRPVVGKPYVYGIGESTEPFTQRSIEEFDRELAKVEQPQDEKLRGEFDNLRALVRKALDDPDLTLVLSVQ